MQEHEPRFTLAELVDASGLPERTIRHYIQAGIVAPALGRGRSRYFTPHHLEQVMRVADLREKRYSLEEIRGMLAPAPEPASDELSATDRWERFVLHPDLELHLRSDAPEGVRALARELSGIARDWFGDEA